MKSKLIAFGLIVVSIILIVINLVIIILPPKAFQYSHFMVGKIEIEVERVGKTNYLLPTTGQQQVG